MFGTNLASLPNTANESILYFRVIENVMSEFVVCLLSLR